MRREWLACLIIFLSISSVSAQRVTPPMPASDITVLPPQPTGLPLELRDFRAAGNGIADDTAAVQAAFNAAIATSNTLHCSPGTYRITSPIYGFSLVNNYIVYGTGKTNGVGGGCTLYIDFNGWGSAAFDFSNQATPSTRSASISLRDITITYNPALTAPPIAIKHRFASNIFYKNVQVMQYTVNRGTAVSISSCFNCRFEGLEIWGAGGYKSAHLVAPGTTFTIASGATALSSNQDEFASSDVGLCLTLRFNASGVVNRNDETLCISAFVDAQHVTTSTAAASAHTGVLGAFSGLLGSITAASNSLTQSSARITSSDAGRTLYVTGAGTVPEVGAKDVFRATVSSASGTTVTLGANATTTSNNAELIIDPALEIYRDPGTGTVQSNDVAFYLLHVEQVSGTPIVLYDSVKTRFVQAKSAGWNNGASATIFGRTDLETQANFAFFGSGAYIDGFFEGTTVSALGSAWLHGIPYFTEIGPLTSSATHTGQPFLSLKFNATNSAFYVGPVVSDFIIAPAWSPSIIATDNSSTYDIVTPFVFHPNFNPPFQVQRKTKTAAQVLALTCDASHTGDRWPVSDANSSTYLAALASGGSTSVIAGCDGTSWKIGY